MFSGVLFPDHDNSNKLDNTQKSDKSDPTKYFEDIQSPKQIPEVPNYLNELP